MKDKIKRSANLAAWLMATGGKKRNVALIIAMNKYKIPKELKPVISKAATIYKKDCKKQKGLFE